MKIWSHYRGQTVTGFTLTDDNQHVNLTTFQAEHLNSFPPSEGFIKISKVLCGGRYLLRLWLVVDSQIWRQNQNKEIWFVLQFFRSPQTSPLTAGRADIVKWGFEDFQSKLDIMQPRSMAIDCKEQGPAAHKSQNMLGHFFLWYPARWMFVLRF